MHLQVWAMGAEIMRSDAAELWVLLHIVCLLEVLADKEAVHSISAREVDEGGVGMDGWLQQGSFVAGRMLARALFAREAHRVPPIVESRESGQFVACALTSVHLLEHKAKLLVAKMRKTLALEG